jgi:pimeloyl-ACP methyl ester carboxylesterase
MTLRTLIAATALALGVASSSQAQTVYGAQLEGFAYPYPLRHAQLSSQGQTLSMAYMDVAPTGPANGQTAVLLHGKNFCAATWEHVIGVLTRAGYRVIAPDQIGFCASTKPQGYQFSFGQLSANTHALLDSIGVRRFVLIGHSMGGMLAARYALIYPEAIEQLVLVNPLGLEDWQAKGLPYATVDQLYADELKTSAASLKAYQQKFYYNGRWKPEYDRWIAMQAGLYAGPGRARVARNQAQTSEMIYTQPVVHELGRITARTVLIIGGKDRTAPGSNRAPKTLADQLGRYDLLGHDAARAIPNATLVEMPELGHAPQMEAPEQFDAALLRVLRR